MVTRDIGVQYLLDHDDISLVILDVAANISVADNVDGVGIHLDDLSAIFISNDRPPRPPSS